MADYEVHLDDAAVYELLNGQYSPLWRLLEDLSEQAAGVARAKVRIRRTPGRSPFPPGFTKASIRTNVHWYQGLIYGGIAAAEEPTIFLEYPAEQMHREYPFMSTAFDSLGL